MAAIGIKHWEGVLVKGKKVSIRYDQTKNSAEALIKKTTAEINKMLGVNNKIRRGYLESCGMSALACEMEGLEYAPVDKPIQFPTGKTIPLDDGLMTFVNLPSNDKLFQAGDVFDNRYWDTIITAAKECFGCDAYLQRFDKDFDFLSVELERGNGVIICLDEPGHYLALIAYDQESDEIIYHDSWGSRNMGCPVLTNKGRYERLNRGDMFNVRSKCAIFPKK